MFPHKKYRILGTSKIPLIVILAFSLFAAGWLGYLLGYASISSKIGGMQDRISYLEGQISNLQSTLNMVSRNITSHVVLQENVSLPQLYERVKNSIVMIRGLVAQYDIFKRPYYVQVQGSGFVYNFTGQIVVITNYHVVSGAINITVTFTNGNGYAAWVLGLDPYVDLAVLLTDAPENEYYPLEITNSSMLRVGDPVITVGNPYGLAGSMSFGIVSALGRTITEELTGGYPIANVIQTTAPLNPGNSGGPLLNYKGQVVGVTTAIVSGSQGVSFAIPSNAILREIEFLVKEGSYNRHPWLGAIGTDMDYEIAKVMNVNVTYGWLITQVISGGPADKAGLLGGTKRIYISGEYVVVGGDIIVGINGEKIKGIDDLSSYLEEHTLPGQTINVTIIRGSQRITLQVKLEARP